MARTRFGSFKDSTVMLPVRIKPNCQTILSSAWLGMGQDIILRSPCDGPYMFQQLQRLRRHVACAQQTQLSDITQQCLVGHGSGHLFEETT